MYTIFGLIFLTRFIAVLHITITGNLALLDSSIIFPLTQLMYLVLLLGVDFTIIILVNEKLQFDFLSFAKEKKQLVRDLQIVASKDFVTQLENRYSMEDHLNKAIGSNHPETSAYILMLDVDHFKLINDSFGHETGDLVLFHMGKILSKHLKDGELVGRWGGDEFAFTFFCENHSHLEQRLTDIILSIRDFPWADKTGNSDFHVTVSGGIAEIRKGTSRREILKQADGYLYDSKMNGRNQVRGPSIIIM